MANLFFAWSKDTILEYSQEPRPWGSLEHAASGQFLSRGVEVGDQLYVVGRNADSEVVLVGRMSVRKVLDQAGAEAELGPGIWEATCHVIGEGTERDFQRVLPRDVLRALQFTADREGESDPRPLDINPGTGLPRGMAMTTARWLTPESAELLDSELSDGGGPARPDAEVVVEQALEGMDVDASIRFFGWVIAVCRSVGVATTAVVPIASQNRIRVYCGVFSAASTWQGYLSISLDSEVLSRVMLDEIEQRGGRISETARSSRSLPRTMVLDIPPNEFDRVRADIEPAFRSHCVAAARVGASGHAKKHRRDIAEYLREAAQDRGVGV